MVALGLPSMRHLEHHHHWWLHLGATPNCLLLILELCNLFSRGINFTQGALYLSSLYRWKGYSNHYIVVWLIFVDSKFLIVFLLSKV
jgi:hypothetical protein